MVASLSYDTMRCAPCADPCEGTAPARATAPTPATRNTTTPHATHASTRRDMPATRRAYGRNYPSRVAIRVVVAEDNYLVREAVIRLLGTQPDVEVVGACADLDSLFALVDNTRPDVVLTDIRMPPSGTDEGIRAAARLRDTHPATGVVVLSQYVEPAYALALLGSEIGRAHV